MGTDIFMYAERKIGDKWERINRYFEFSQRSYDLFTWLGCDMRDVPVGPWANRGWPEDSPHWEPRPEPHDSDGWNTFGFHHSWVSLRELLTTEVPEDYRWFVDDVLKEPALIGCDPDSTRILFRFDN